MDDILEEFVFNQLPVPMPLRGTAPNGQAELANNDYDVVRLLSEPLFPLVSTMSDLLDSEADNIIEASPKHALIFINESEVVRVLKTELKSPSKSLVLQRSDTISSTSSSVLHGGGTPAASAATSLEEKSIISTTHQQVPLSLSRTMSAATPVTSVDSYSLPQSFPSNEGYFSQSPMTSTDRNGVSDLYPIPTTRRINLSDRI